MIEKKLHYKCELCEAETVVREGAGVMVVATGRTLLADGGGGEVDVLDRAAFDSNARLAVVCDKCYEKFAGMLAILNRKKRTVRFNDSTERHPDRRIEEMLKIMRTQNRQSSDEDDEPIEPFGAPDIVT